MPGFIIAVARSKGFGWVKATAAQVGDDQAMFLMSFQLSQSDKGAACNFQLFEQTDINIEKEKKIHFHNPRAVGHSLP